MGKKRLLGFSFTYGKKGSLGFCFSWSRDQAMARARIADRSRESAICAAASNASLETDGALARVAAVGRVEAAALAAAADGVAQQIEFNAAIWGEWGVAYGENGTMVWHVGFAGWVCLVALCLPPLELP